MIVLARKERDRQLRKSDILTAAEHVFALNGYEKATIQDIAKEAQYATGTVYLYFKDKESLYLYLVEEKIASIMSICREETAKVDDATRKLEIYIKETLNFFEKNRDFFRIFVLEKSKHQWTIDRKLSKSPALTNKLKLVAELIKTSQDQGVIRKDLNAEQVADILMAILSTIIFGWLNGEMKETAHLSDMAEYVADIFLKGVKQ